MRCIHNDSLWLVPWSCDNVYRRFFHDCELLWFFEGRFFRILAFASETWTREVGQKWRSCQTSTNNNHIIEFRVCALSSSPTVCCGCCRCSGSKCQRVSEMHHHNWIIAFIWLMDDAVPSIQQQLNQHYRRPCHPKKEVLLEEWGKFALWQWEKGNACYCPQHVAIFLDEWWQRLYWTNFCSSLRHKPREISAKLANCF